MSSSSSDYDEQDEFLPLFVTGLTQRPENEEKITFQSEEEELAYFRSLYRNKPLKSCTIRDLMEIELPQKEYLLYPIIGYKSLSMLFASRGIGKTFLVD